LALRASDIAHPRILLVEDQRDNWVLAIRILTGAGYQVDLAENGLIAVEKAAGYKYDLILMDLEMPVLDGLQAATAIRAAEMKAQKGWVPIVALTAHALEGFRERAISSGMDDYVTKPIKKQQLLDICEKWIDARPVIMIIDDSAESQLLITKYLRDRNYQIVTANDGQGAVDIFKRQRVSALLLDMEMPVMDGYEAARIIRKLPGGAKVPIVAMTGHEGAAAREKCMTAGCSAFVSKPVRRSEIVEILDAILGPAEVKSTPLPSGFDGVESDYSPSYDATTNTLEMSTLRRYAAQRRGDLLSMEARKLERFAEACDLRDLKVSAAELVYAASRDDNDAISLWLDRVAEAMKTSERLMSVRGTGLLDSPPEESLDRLTRIAATALQVPTTMITLVDQDRQFWKSAVGVKEPYATARGTAISHSFCYHVADRAEPLVVSDARENPLVMHNPAISDLDIIAYAGMPLITSKGIALGSFGAIDSKPKDWTDADLALLRDLASLAATQLERSAADREGAGLGATSGEFFAPASPQLDLEDEIDDEIVELVPAYLESMKESAKTLSALLLEKNFSAIKRIGHQMKGSGAGYGFDEITRMGRHIETAAGKKDYIAVATLHSALATYLDQEVERRAGTAVAP
jgi:CheY-like chemotaxis protein/HPt (histidine-containing phosphotransfer) domain-containing protein